MAASSPHNYPQRFADHIVRKRGFPRKFKTKYHKGSFHSLLNSSFLNYCSKKEPYVKSIYLKEMRKSSPPLTSAIPLCKSICRIFSEKMEVSSKWELLRYRPQIHFLIQPLIDGTHLIPVKFGIIVCHQPSLAGHYVFRKIIQFFLGHAVFVQCLFRAEVI